MARRLKFLLADGFDERSVLWPKFGGLLFLVRFLAPQRAQLGVIFSA